MGVGFGLIKQTWRATGCRPVERLSSVLLHLWQGERQQRSEQADT